LRLGSPVADPSVTPPPRELDEGLWSLDRQLLLPVGGARLPVRTTILRDPAGRLLLISPPRLDDVTRGQLTSLGTIGGVIAPNSFHHLHVQSWLDAFPDIEVFAAPGVSDRTGALPTAQTLLRENPPDWR